MSFSEWREVRLDETNIDIIDGDRGNTYPKKNEFYSNGHCLFLNAKNVTSEGFSFNEAMYIDEDKDKLLRKGKLKRRDVILTTRGTVGNVAFYGDNIKQECVRINSGMVIIRPDETEYDSEFIYWLFRSPIIQEQINSIRTGSAQPQLPINIMKTLKFRRPPIQEQKAITHVISTLDEKIEVNNKINKTLEDIAQAIFKHWFVDFEFPNEDGETYKSSGGELVESELGPIPNGWEIGCINDIAINKKDSVRTSDLDENDNYIGLEHVPRKQLFLDNWGSSSDITSNKYRFGKGDILFGKLRPYFHKVVFAPIDGVCSTDILVITSKNKLQYPFLLMNLFSEEVIDYANAVSTGTRMPRVNWNNIGRYKIVVPNDETLANYSAILNPIIDKFNDVIQENRILTLIRDSLLPKLMSGEIRVPLDIEEQ